jgi:hypothetical protein
MVPPCGAQCFQPLDFGRYVVGFEVEVHPLLAALLVGRVLKEDTDVRIRQPQPAVHVTALRSTFSAVASSAAALGHSTPTVTLNTYVHERPDVLDRTRALVDGALGQGKTAATPARSRA